MEKLQKIKALVYVLSVSFVLTILDELFLLEFSENFLVLIGLVMIVTLIWLFVVIHQIKKIL